MMAGTDAVRTSNPHQSQRYPKRLTLDLSQDNKDALTGARYADRVPMADRIRALVSLWREGPDLAQMASTRTQVLLPPPPGSTARPTRPGPEQRGGPPDC
jgi:hypothetical protein